MDGMMTRAAFVRAAAVMPACALIPRKVDAESEDGGRLSITVLNPDCMAGGAGLCVVIRTPKGKTYLFDTGNGCPHTDKVKNNGKDIVAPWLKARGVNVIDGVIISHYHADHFGGFLWLWDHFPIRRVYDNTNVPSDGRPLREHDAVELRRVQDALNRWEKRHPGMLIRHTNDATELGWDEPDVSFDVVWPPSAGPVTAIADFRKTSETDFPFHHLLNANSTAIRIRAYGRTFYVGGDNSSAQYMEKYIRPYHERHGTWGCDVCVLPGHGDPTACESIAKMHPKPAIAIASLGNLPWMMERGRQVLGAYVDGADIRKTYCTNIHGDVTVSAGPDGDLSVTCDSERLFRHDPR